MDRDNITARDRNNPKKTTVYCIYSFDSTNAGVAGKDAITTGLGGVRPCFRKTISTFFFYDYKACDSLKKLHESLADPLQYITTAPKDEIQQNLI